MTTEILFNISLDTHYPKDPAKALTLPAKSIDIEWSDEELEFFYNVNEDTELAKWLDDSDSTTLHPEDCMALADFFLNGLTWSGTNFTGTFTVISDEFAVKLAEFFNSRTTSTATIV